LPPLPRDFYLDSRVHRGIGVLLVGATGWIFYVFRRCWRALFGLFEIAFALVSAWQILGNEMSNMTAAVSIMGIIYLLVRGGDNCTIGTRGETSLIVKLITPRKVN
jgi:hypothetical protein